MPAADLEHLPAGRLEELAALNAELAGLVRGGLPLELGVSAGGLRGLGDRVGERLRQGESLDAALAAEGDRLPAAYRAVVSAGLRSGRLAEAVETVSRTAASLAALRRRLAVAAIYPTVLLAVGYLVLVVFVPRVVFVAADLSDGSARVGPWFASADRFLRGNPTGWQWWVPLVAAALLWWTGGLAALTRRLPGLGTAVRSYRIAAFAELAAGLLEQGTPVDEAVLLASDASADRRLAAEARAAAERLRAGEPPEKATEAFASLPLFALWMITAGAAQGTLPASLRQVADWSSRRGDRRADLFRMIAPVAVTVLVGGAVAAVTAAAVFGPLLALFHGLAEPEAF